MVTFTTVLALLAFPAAGSTSGQNLQKQVSQNKVLLLNPIWFVDKDFVDNHGEGKLAELINKLRVVLQGLETEVTSGQKVSVELSDGSTAPTKLNSTLPPTYDNLDWMAEEVKHNLQLGSNQAGAYIVVSGSKAGQLLTLRTGPSGSAIACFGEKKYRMILLRYIDDDDTTVTNMAQAVGRFLGIYYDRMCRNVGGYMDYIDHYGSGNRWTSCSKNELKEHYNAGELSCLEKDLQPVKS